MQSVWILPEEEENKQQGVSKDVFIKFCIYFFKVGQLNKTNNRQHATKPSSEMIILE